jgi:hypothetical protein
MGLFSAKPYEPGGEHHVRINDAVFDEATNLLASDSELKKQYKEFAEEHDVLKYEAHDFPVTEIIAKFFGSYELQEKALGTPDDLRIENIQLGRKDLVEYNKFIERFNAKMEHKDAAKKDKWERKSLGGKLLSKAVGAAAKGIAGATTGKSEEVRWFEKTFADYLCGDSEKAKAYLSHFATEFGGTDEGVLDVAKAIREQFWVSEFAKYNRRR